MKLNLGFDLDEVVVNLTGVIEEHLKKAYGIHWPASRFTEYILMDGTYHENETLNKAIQDDLWRLANSPEFQSLSKPFRGAKEALSLLKKKGHKIFFVTSRPKRNERFTLEWLEKYRVPFDGLVMVGHAEEKGVYGNKLNLDMFVDDLEKHLVSMLHHRKTWSKGLLLFDRPWNVRDTRFDRVDGWAEVVACIENNA